MADRRRLDLLGQAMEGLGGAQAGGGVGRTDAFGQRGDFHDVSLN